MNSKFGECCNCPALVDGRFFTEYRDRDALQFNIMKDNNLTNSNAFRNFLITNGTSVMSNNTKDLETKYKCNYNIQNPVPVTSIQNGKFINEIPLVDAADNIAPFEVNAPSLR
jgi:hypothetical protein